MRYWLLLAAALLIAIAYCYWPEAVATNISNDEPLIPVQRDNKWGYITTTGKIAIPFVWDDAESFDNDGKASVELGQYVGMIDRTGKVVVPLVYQNIDLVSPTELLRVVRRDLKSGIVDRDWKTVIPREWDDLTADWNDPSIDRLIAVRRGGRWGWINRQNEIVVPLDWDLARSDRDHDTRLLPVCRAKLWGYVDAQTGQCVIEPAWETARDFHGHTAALVSKRKKLGMIDRHGNLIWPIEWDRVLEWPEQQLTAVSKNGQWGIVDHDGKIITPIQWSNVSAFDKFGLARVRQGQLSGCSGWIDRSGKLVIPVQWNANGGQLDDHPTLLSWVQVANRWGIIDRHGEIRVPCVFDAPDGVAFFASWEQSRIAAIKDQKAVIINDRGDIVLQTEWERAGFFNGFQILEQGEHLVFADLAGNVVVDIGERSFNEAYYNGIPETSLHIDIHSRSSPFHRCWDRWRIRWKWLPQLPTDDWRFDQRMYYYNHVTKTLWRSFDLEQAHMIGHLLWLPMFFCVWRAWRRRMTPVVLENA